MASVKKLVHKSTGGKASCKNLDTKNACKAAPFTVGMKNPHCFFSGTVVCHIICVNQKNTDHLIHEETSHYLLRKIMQ
ncbi:hypothetical protein ACHAW6_010034 [Cyclotella cf. meneghiniana]